MSAISGRESHQEQTQTDASLALVAGRSGSALTFAGDGVVTRAQFLAHVRGVAATLPDCRHAINLCEGRYHFLVALCAAAARGQVSLLPSSRARGAIDAVRHLCASSYGLRDAQSVVTGHAQDQTLPDLLPERSGPAPRVQRHALAVIGFTSGSTGPPTANAKTWASFRISTIQNLTALRDLWPANALARIVATVPPQHMYGMELSVLLPLFGPAAVHAGRPFFPHDIAAALAHAPAHRLLVTTPVHLRALVESGVTLPRLAGIVSATAPLSMALAAEAEARYGCEVRELFGSTETCIIARRRAARETTWTPLPGVSVTPRPDGALVRAAHLPAPVRLADLVEVGADGRFELCGRNADLLEIAGKRASLADLTCKLQAIPGVLDGVVLQTDPDTRGLRRIAAAVVAPDLRHEQILAALRETIDPVFLPRPLVQVPKLPRNDVGKLSREALLMLLCGELRS